MSNPETVTRRGYLLLALGSAAYACFTFVWFTVPAFLPPIVQDLGLSSTMAGLVAGAIPLTYIPLALASGLVVDRIGPGRAIAIGLLLLGTAGAARAAADGFLALFLLTAVVGVGGTGVTFGLPKLVSVVVPSARAGSATSAYVVGASAGTAAAFSAGRPLLGPALGGWRPVLLWSGVAVVAFALVWTVVVRGTTAWATRGGDAAGGVEPDPGGDSVDGRDSGAASADVLRDLRAVLTHRGLRLLVVVGTVYLLVTHGTQAWLAAILEHRGFSPGTAAALTTVLVVARTVGVLAVPPISDAFDVRRAVVVGSGVLMAVGVGGLVVSSTSLPLSAAVVVVAGIGLGGLSPMIRTIPIELPGIGPRLTGTATGLIFAVGEVGGFAGPVLVGTLFDLTGTYAFGLGVLAAGGVVVAVAGRSIPETGGASG